MPTDQVKKNNIDQIKQLIQKQEASSVFHIKIPSLNRMVPFLEINTLQQKKLVKSVVDSPVFNTEFIYAMRDIIQTNIQEKDINIDNLTIIDKLFIILNIRRRCIGDQIDLDVTLKSGKSVKAAITISKVLDQAEATLNKVEPLTFEESGYRISCDIPTIGIEYMAEKARPDRADIEIKNAAELRSMVGEIFISEATKYIRSIECKGEGTGEYTPIPWDTIEFAERINIIEMINMRATRKVIDYADQVQKEIEKIELLRFNVGKEEFEERLSLKGDFFIIS